MKRLRFSLLPLLLALILILCACDDAMPASPEVADAGFEVHFLDVGQADSTLVICEGFSMLIDGGNPSDSSLIVAYLMDQGIAELDYVIGTHAHEDHIGGLAGVMAVFPVGEVFCPVDEHDSKAFRDFKKYTSEQGLTLQSPVIDSSVPLGAATVTFLGPRSEYQDANNTSIVLVIDYGDTSFLLSGDAQRQSENEIMDAERDIGVTVMKAGHHGSGSSNSYRWIYEAEPLHAVISCGTGNSYGHPHEEVMSRFHDADVQVWRTDTQGHIVCSSDGKSVSFRVQRNADADTNPQPELSGGYIGNKNSKVFHRDSCSGLPAESNRVYFENRADAIELQYRSCGLCKP